MQEKDVKSSKTQQQQKKNHQKNNKLKSVNEKKLNETDDFNIAEIETDR